MLCGLRIHVPLKERALVELRVKDCWASESPSMPLEKLERGRPIVGGVLIVAGDSGIARDVLSECEIGRRERGRAAVLIGQVGYQPGSEPVVPTGAGVHAVHVRVIGEAEDAGRGGIAASPSEIGGQVIPGAERFVGARLHLVRIGIALGADLVVVAGSQRRIGRGVETEQAPSPGLEIR